MEPLDKQKIQRIEKSITIGFAVFALIYLFLIKDYVPNAKLIPSIVAIATIIVAVLQYLGDYIPQLKPIAKGDDTISEERRSEMEPWLSPVGRHRAYLIGGWTLALGLLVWLFGFVISVPLFLFVFLKTFDNVSWRITLGVPAVVGYLTYFLIVQLLELDPFDAVFFRLVFG